MSAIPKSFFFSSRRRHTRCLSDWSSDVCSSDLSFCSPPLLSAFLGAGGEFGEAVFAEECLGGFDKFILREQAFDHVEASLDQDRERLLGLGGDQEIGRASCRERGEIRGGAGG